MVRRIVMMNSQRVAIIRSCSRALVIVAWVDEIGVDSDGRHRHRRRHHRLCRRGGRQVHREHARTMSGFRCVRSWMCESHLFDFEFHLNNRSGCVCTLRMCVY